MAATATAIELTERRPPATSTHPSSSSSSRSKHPSVLVVADSSQGMGEAGPSSGEQPDPGDLLSSTSKAKDWVHFVSLCLPLFSAGYHDNAMGPMLPRVQEAYGLRYLLVSLIFVFISTGFVIGAFSNIFLNARYSFGKIIFGASLCQILGHAIQVGGPPFPAFVVGGFINGFGISIQDAQANGYIAAQHKLGATKMGILHAAYGFGCFVSPLVSTQFSRMPGSWHFFYFTGLALAIVNSVNLAVVFRFRTQAECLKEIGEHGISELPADAQDRGSHFKQIMRYRGVHLLAAFIFVYLGICASLGGWMVTFIISERGGGANSGYVSGGIAGGLVLGRLLLIWVNHKLGERLAVYVYAGFIIALEIILWRVHSLVGNAIAAGLIGFFLGPMYAIAIMYANRVLPPWLVTSAVGWISGIGVSGSAIMPFVAGAIADKTGFNSLMPLLLTLSVLLVIVWYCVPTPKPAVLPAAGDHATQ